MASETLRYRGSLPPVAGRAIAESGWNNPEERGRARARWSNQLGVQTAKSLRKTIAMIEGGEYIRWEHTGPLSGRTTSNISVGVGGEKMPAVDTETSAIAASVARGEDKPRGTRDRRLSWARTVAAGMAGLSFGVAGAASVDTVREPDGLAMRLAGFVERESLAALAKMAESRAGGLEEKINRIEASLVTLERRIIALDFLFSSTEWVPGQEQDEIGTETTLVMAGFRIPTWLRFGESAAMAESLVEAGADNSGVQPETATTTIALSEVASIAASDVTTSAYAGDSVGKAVARFAGSWTASCTEQCPIIADPANQGILSAQVRLGENSVREIADLMVGAGYGNVVIQPGDTFRMTRGLITAYVGNTEEVRFAITRETEVREARVASADGDA